MEGNSNNKTGYMFLWGWNMQEIPPPGQTTTLKHKSTWEINFNGNFIFKFEKNYKFFTVCYWKGKERGKNVMFLDVFEL